MDILFITLLTLLPIAVTFLFYFLDKKTKFGNLSKIYKTIIIGLAFAVVSILEVVLGVPFNGCKYVSIMNAGPLLAGFVFSGPSGIIAGAVAGIYRFLSLLWGGYKFTVWADGISLIFAGIYAFLLRKFMFDNKHIAWGFGIAFTIVLEVLHLTMIFVFNAKNASDAMDVVKAISTANIIGNVIAVFIPLLFIRLIRKKEKTGDAHLPRISTQVQWWLLASIVFSYTISTIIVYAVQTNTAQQEAEDMFKLTISDVVSDVNETSDKYMLNLLNQVQSELNVTFPYDTTKQTEYEHRFADLVSFKFNIYSIDIVGNDGYIICSSAHDLYGFEYPTFNMMEYEQSSEVHNAMKNPYCDPFVQKFQLQGDVNVGELKKYAAKRLNADYYLAISLDGDQFYSLVNEKICDITSYRHVKRNGFILILDANGNVTSDKSVLQDVALLNLDKTQFRNTQNENKMLQGMIDGRDSFYLFTTAETYTLVIVLPYEEVLSDRDSSFILNTFMEIIIFAFLYVLIYFLIKHLVVIKIDKVNGSLDKIIKGDLNEKVQVASSKEFASLSDDINYTVDALKKYIADAAKRIDDELAFAKSIQLSALPSTFPAFPDRDEFDIYATMNTAKEVGGDFYDFYIYDRNKLAFLIADVSGKGIPAAMCMMESKATIKNLAKSLLPSDEVMSQANDALAQNNDANMFITCWFGTLDLDTGHVTFANAGHNFPLIYRHGGSWEYISQKKNLVLGVQEGISYKLQEFDLKPGDKLYLYTDGVTEATRRDGELYGEERLAKYLNSNIGLSLKDTLLGVKSDIDVFVEGADQFDDITMLTIEFKGKAKKGRAK